MAFIFYHEMPAVTPIVTNLQLVCPPPTLHSLKIFILIVFQQFTMPNIILFRFALHNFYSLYKLSIGTFNFVEYITVIESCNMLEIFYLYFIVLKLA